MSRIDDSGLVPYEMGTVKAFENRGRIVVQYCLSGEPPVSLTIRRSRQARRISLRISQLDGRVTLTLPHGVADREGLEFAESKSQWIRDHLARQPDVQPVEFGSEIPIEGRPRRIEPIAGRRVVLGTDTIGVPGAEPAARLRGFLIQLARERLVEASDRYAAALGRSYERITLRDTRSRWGSCSAQGALMYSWRLILADPAILTYVAAHEVAHLQELNHSSAFWALVEQLYGDYEPSRSWLREQGTALHRFRF